MYLCPPCAVWSPRCSTVPSSWASPIWSGRCSRRLPLCWPLTLTWIRDRRRTNTGAPPTSSDISFKARRIFYQTIYQLGSHFTHNPLRIKAAAERAWQVHQDYLRLMQRGLTPPEAIARWEGDGTQHPTRIMHHASHTITLIGHPYNLYDTYITHNLMAKLRGLGVKVVTSEMATPEELRQGILDLTGQPYWTYEDEVVVGVAGHYLHDERVDGFIAVGSFGCSPDSTLLDVVQRAAREARRPFMSLIIDEHTGEAGLVTRLEAFVDMLARQKRRKERSGGGNGRLFGD